MTATPPITGTVAQTAPAMMLDVDQRTCNLLVTLTYDPDQPLDVQLTIPGVPEHEWSWVFARDLLADGIHQPAGLGDVQVWPTGALVRIRLSSMDRSAEFSVPAAVVARFLAATVRRVPYGAERVDVGVDALLARLFGRCVMSAADYFPDNPNARVVLAADLRTAAQYLTVHGWCQHDFETADGSVCLMTAIGKAIPKERAQFVHRAVGRYLRDECDRDVIGWNDDVCQDRDQAVAMLRSLADQIDGRVTT